MWHRGDDFDTLKDLLHNAGIGICRIELKLNIERIYSVAMVDCGVAFDCFETARTGVMGGCSLEVVQVLLQAQHRLANREKRSVKVDPAVRFGGRKRLPAA